MNSSTMARADATGQSRLPKNSSHKTCPIIEVDDEPSRSGMTNSPTIGMQQSRQPATMPGSDSGTVTVKKVRHGGAPRSAAASSSVSSSFSSAASSDSAARNSFAPSQPAAGSNVGR